MRGPVLNEKRNRQILAEIVRAFIETGEPVSSRVVARRHPEALSPATVRNVMADLEEEGYLFQPHTSAGRVPTASAYRFFAQEAGARAILSEDDQNFIRRELAAANSAEEIMERASHVLASISQGLGIVVSPPLSRTMLKHIKFVLLPDQRVLAVMVSEGGLTRDKLFRPERSFSQGELDRTANFLNSRFAGWTLSNIRAHLETLLAQERERYQQLAQDALLLCDPKVLDDDPRQQLYVEGAAQIVTAPDFEDQNQLRELLAAIEEKSQLVALLTSCIEGPEPVQVQIGVKAISAAGEHLSLISAPFAFGDAATTEQGSLGVLGPMRMEYERAITAVAFVARLFSESAMRSRGGGEKHG
jgi:heat-inducible transcriptional repressor